MQTFTQKVMDLLESEAEWVIVPQTQSITHFSPGFFVMEESSIVALVGTETDAKIISLSLSMLRILVTGVTDHKYLHEAAYNLVHELFPDHCPLCGGRWEIHSASACREENPQDEDDEPWYWLMESEIDTEEFGPYDTEEEAIAGTRRVQAEAGSLADGIKRRYSAPYQGKGNSDGADDEDEETTAAMAAAERKGREAATLGLTPEHCPYPITTEAAAHWLSGFSQAQSLEEEWTP